MPVAGQALGEAPAAGERFSQPRRGGLDWWGERPREPVLAVGQNHGSSGVSPHQIRLAELLPVAKGNLPICQPRRA